MPIGRPPSVDTTRFADPSTEEEAYWLGFLFTDGCMRGTNVIINLAERDSGHLDKFAAFMRCPRKPIHWSKRRPDAKDPRAVYRYASFNFTSQVIAPNLRRLGMRDAKTWSVRPWKGPPELMRHFWRGCIDGDGSIHLSHFKARGFPHSSWRLHFCGNRAMVNGLRAFVESSLGIATRTYPGNSTSGLRFRSVRWSERAAAVIVRFLYGDSAISLDRKREAAEALLLRRESRKGTLIHHCSTPGCTRPYKAKGTCGTCYRRERRSRGLDRPPIKSGTRRS